MPPHGESRARQYVTSVADCRDDRSVYSVYMAQKLTEPLDLDVEFTGPIGVEVKGSVWSCVEVPDSAELFGTKATVRCDVRVDDVDLPNIGLMVTGRGGHMISLSAPVRKKLAKDVGDDVRVRLLRRNS